MKWMYLEFAKDVAHWLCVALLSSTNMKMKCNYVIKTSHSFIFVLIRKKEFFEREGQKCEKLIKFKLGRLGILNQIVNHSDFGDDQFGC